jgi:tetratricopeptide (TPR) repeat protein
VPGHDLRCAERARRRALAEAGGVGELGPGGAARLASAIAGCCGHTRLKAFRLAHGWSVEETVRRLHELAASVGAGPLGLAARSLVDWEAGDAMRRDYQDLLCRLYRTGPVQLGLAVDYTPPPEEAAPAASPGLPADGRAAADSALVPAVPCPPDWPAAPSGVDVEPPDGPAAAVGLPTVLAGVGVGLGEAESAAVERLRWEANRVFGGGSVSPAWMEVIEAEVGRRRREYTRQPPAPALAAVLGLFSEVRGLCAVRQATGVQRRLSVCAAQLGTLAADALMKLGRLGEAWDWYGTARLAADDGEDPELRARVRAQAAMLPYYYGDAAEAVRLAREAQALAPARPVAAVALAVAAEARALARLGDRAAARDALDRAHEVFEHTDGADSGDAFRFPEKRFFFYYSGALGYLGDLDRAVEAQDRALRLYDGHDGFVIDSTLVVLDRARCLAARGAGEGCRLAAEAIMALPAGHRTRIVWARAADVLRGVPPEQRGLPAAGELREVVADAGVGGL